MVDHKSLCGKVCDILAIEFRGGPSYFTEITNLVTLTYLDDIQYALEDQIGEEKNGYFSKNM